MNSRIHCPRCQRSLAVSTRLAGRAGQCPHCSCRFRLPTQLEDPHAVAVELPPAPPRPVQAAPPPPPIDAPWMYMHGGQIIGPVSQPQLAQLHQTGYIPVDCPVIHVPSGRWMRLHHVPGMFAPAGPPMHAAPGVPPYEGGHFPFVH